MRHLLWAVPLLCGTVPAGCDFISTRPTGANRNPGDPLVEVVDYPAIEQAVAAGKGKVVIVDFWATWCPPCVRSFPHLVEIHEKYNDRGLVCIAASLDDPSDQDVVKKFLEDHHVNFKALILKKSAATAKGLKGFFNYQGGIPHMVMFNRNGERVWDSSTNHLSNRALDQRIEQELGQ